MDYPMQVWYGVYFSGEDVDTPLLPAWVRDMLEAGEDTRLEDELNRRGYKGADLAWVFCGENFGLAVAESVQIVLGEAGELVKYPADIADTWAIWLASALAAIETGAARITWYASIWRAVAEL